MDRPFQFNLRTLLLVTAPVASVVGFAVAFDHYWRDTDNISVRYNQYRVEVPY